MKRNKISVFALGLIGILSLASCKTTSGKIDFKVPEEIDIGTKVSLTAEQLKDAGFSEENPLRIGLVTDSGTLNDHSFNESSWNGVNAFAVNNGGGTINDKGIVSNGLIHTQYAQPAENHYDAQGRFNAMKTIATDFKANVIVLPGYLFQSAINMAQNDEAFKDVYLVGLDCAEKDDDGNDIKFTDKVTAVSYREEQSGFLAGYASVAYGYRKLGFVGGMAVPAVVRFGSGWVQGAAQAADDLNLENPVEMNYYYANKFAATPEATRTVTEWYNKGTEIIFACGGALYMSVTESIKGKPDKAWVGVDVNQYEDTSITGDARTGLKTSAMKNLKMSVEVLLTSWVENGKQWPKDLKAEAVTVGAKSDMCQLPTEGGSWGFGDKFSIEDYNKLYARIKSGDIKVNAFDDDAILSENNFGVDEKLVKVNYTK